MSRTPSFLAASLVTLLSLAAAVPAVAQATTGTSTSGNENDEKLVMRITKLDTNKDGVVEKSEYEVLLLRGFNRMDADKNGTVTMAEIEAVGQKHGWSETKTGKMAKRLGVTDTAGLTKDQYLAGRTTFTLIDADGDGKLTVTEIETYATKVEQRRASHDQG